LARVAACWGNLPVDKVDPSSPDLKLSSCPHRRNLVAALVQDPSREFYLAGRIFGKNLVHLTAHELRVLPEWAPQKETNGDVQVRVYGT
jgi:hypothetical protein